jgi:translation elongation factor aEF-1 beta
MGEVLLKYRLTPEDSDTDLAQVEKAVRGALDPKVAKISKAEVQPFVFGMKVLVVSIVVQDEEGNNDKVEAWLTTTPGVQGADLLDIGRLM